MKALCPDCYHGKVARPMQPAPERPCSNCGTLTSYLAPIGLADLVKTSRALKLAARAYAQALAFHRETVDETAAFRLARAESALDEAAVAFAEVKAARKVTPTTEGK